MPNLVSFTLTFSTPPFFGFLGFGLRNEKQANGYELGYNSRSLALDYIPGFACLDFEANFLDQMTSEFDAT